jgi:hypothetical protein
MKYSIGKSAQGTKEFITHEDLVAISKDIIGSKGKFNNQQWAKIRKLIKKELA